MQRRLPELPAVFKIGGAQAIAAMAYGTATVPKVYKIFGPGNQYVTAAKQLVSRGDVAIDMPAGPSELAVIADETARSCFCCIRPVVAGRTWNRQPGVVIHQQ